MIRNEKGSTIFELLITISIAGVIISMLLSILAMTLLTKNQIDYTNRLDDEIFDITDYLSSDFQNMGYKSIRIYDNQLVLSEGQSVFLLTTEFRPTFDTVDQSSTISFIRDEFTVKILLLDIARDTIYYETLFSVDPLGDVADQINQFIAQLDSRVSAFVSNPTSPISSSNLVLYEGSEIVYKSSDSVEFCTKFYNQTRLATDFAITPLVSPCANAYININLVVSARLNNGAILPSKTYYSTLFY